MKSDKTVLVEHDDLEMLKRPHLWPHWPRLPLMRVRNHALDTALVLEDEGNAVLFYLNANLFQSPGEWGVPVSRTPEELVADGWMVD